MRIEIRGRNVEVTDELREHVMKRFLRVGKQVSELATLDVEFYEERNPSIADLEEKRPLRGERGDFASAEAAPRDFAIHELAEDIRRMSPRAFCDLHFSGARLPGRWPPQGPLGHLTEALWGHPATHLPSLT